MSKTMDTIKTKLNFDNVDTTPPNDIVQGLAAQVNEATKGMVSCGKILYWFWIPMKLYLWWVY